MTDLASGSWKTKMSVCWSESTFTSISLESNEPHQQKEKIPHRGLVFIFHRTYLLALELIVDTSIKSTRQILQRVMRWTHREDRTTHSTELVFRSEPRPSTFYTDYSASRDFTQGRHGQRLFIMVMDQRTMQVLNGVTV